MFTICRTGPYLSTVQQQLQHGQHCLQRRRAAAHQAAGGAGRIVHTGAEAKPRFGRVFNGSMMNDYIYIYIYIFCTYIYIYKQYIISSRYIAHIYIYSFPTSLCGVLVFDSVSCLLLDRLRLRLRPPSLSPTTLSHTHTIFHTPLCHPPSFTHNFVSHHLSHTTLSPTILHIQFCHPPSFTHHFVTHHLSHTIFHTALCHPPSFTHHFVTHHLSHTTLSPTIFHTHTALSPTIFRTPSFTHHLSHTHTTLSQLFCHPPSFTRNFVTH